MKFNKIMPLAVLTIAFVLGATSAHAENWQANLNLAKVGEVTGSEVELGYDFGNERFRLTPIVGAFIYKNDDDRYYNDSFSNGQSRCRDSSNGQFADSSYCAPDVQAFAKFEGAVHIGKSWEVGAGVRVAEQDTTPYVLVGAQFSNNGRFKLFGGKDYAGVGIGLRF